MAQRLFNIEVKVRETYFLAYQIVEGWKAIRQAGPRLFKAITIYDALLAGDVSLLYQEFPWLAQTKTFVPVPTKPLPVSEVELKDVNNEPVDDDFLKNFLDSL